MTLTHRLKRRLGHDTTIKLDETFEVYKYEIYHTNGETSTVRGNSHRIKEGFLDVYDYPTVGLVDIYCPPVVSPSFSCTDWDCVGHYGNIQDWDRTHVADDEWTVNYDKADGTYEVSRRPYRLEK